MSNGNDSYIDKDGNVHEKGWDGQYHPKQGMFGSERDVSFPGQPNVERDLLSNPVEARDPLSNPIRSASGDSLFHRLGGGGGGSSSGSSQDAGGIGLVLLLAGLPIVGIVVGVILIIDGVRTANSSTSDAVMRILGGCGAILASLVVYWIFESIGLQWLVWAIASLVGMYVMYTLVPGLILGAVVVIGQELWRRLTGNTKK
jgi:hypothetical protein